MELSVALALEEGVERTAALVAWVQGLYHDEPEVPILVGGGAVELYTSGGYTTGDLDFVGSVSTRVADALARAGFARAGRHWVHDAGEVFLEFPSDTLGPDERVAWFDVAGERLWVIAVEDLLVDRLGCWQYWKSAVDGVNAWLLWRAWGSRLDAARLESRLATAGWAMALNAVRALAARLAGREPSSEELEQWAIKGP